MSEEGIWILMIMMGTKSSIFYEGKVLRVQGWELLFAMSSNKLSVG